jgi:hypothetical protein
VISRLPGPDLPAGDWALFGSGPLLVRGWIGEVGDLDVISRGPAWERARELGHASLLSDGNEIVTIGEALTIGTTWAYGSFDIDQLIDTAEMISGVPCVTIDHVVAYKRIANRSKDRAHLAIIEANT